MQITVFGASGKVGSLVVEEALRRGHRVVAFVHSRDLFVPDNNLIVLKGDVHSVEDVAGAVQGSDGVVSALGSWGTKRRDILASAMHALIPAMESAQISRIVTLTGSGAAAPGVRPSAGHRLLQNLLRPLPAGKVFYDGEEHMRLLAESSLSWTTVRSPVMNNFGGESYHLNFKVGSPLETIKRSVVARCLLDQLESDRYVRMAPIIHR